MHIPGQTEALCSWPLAMAVSQALTPRPNSLGLTQGPNYYFQFVMQILGQTKVQCSWPLARAMSQALKLYSKFQPGSGRALSDFDRILKIVVTHTFA